MVVLWQDIDSLFILLNLKARQINIVFIKQKIINEYCNLSELKIIALIYSNSESKDIGLHND